MWLQLASAGSVLHQATTVLSGGLGETQARVTHTVSQSNSYVVS